MYIRVFSAEDRGVGAYLNFLRLEMSGGAHWTVEFCDPNAWLPASVADLQLHIDTPIRLAIPWGRFNAFSALNIPQEWAWTKRAMNMFVDRDALEEKKAAIKALRGLISAAKRFRSPPALPQPYVTLPQVGIITVTRNRAAWWPNMIGNVLKQDWPLANLEWLIVADGADLSGEVATLREKHPALRVKYVHVADGVTVGEKRNIAVRAADAATSMFVCMDDDDYYPSSSVAARATWLNSKPGISVAYCSTLPIYDARRYISAMSVPPLDADPSQRVSEASLCFTRAFWEEAAFPDVSMAEGEFFLLGRMEKSVEMPPMGIIVSLVHGSNTSSRRVPAEQEPNGSHYGFSDEYFEWLTHVACSS